MSKKTTPAQAKGNLKSVTAKTNKAVATKKKAPAVKKVAPAKVKTSSKQAVSKSKKTPAVKKTAAKKLAPIQPTLTAYVEFRSCVTGELVTRTFEVTKAGINDVDWYGGNCGDYFFDNEFETNEERFEQRLHDWVHFLLWEGESDGEPVEAELNGNHPDGLDYHDRLDIYWESEFPSSKFYPI